MISQNFNLKSIAIHNKERNNDKKMQANKAYIIVLVQLLFLQIYLKELNYPATNCFRIENKLQKVICESIGFLNIVLAYKPYFKKI